MVAGDLITRLLDIDRAVARGDHQQARALIAEMEDRVLALERELLDSLRELGKLRAHVETLTTSPVRRRFLLRPHGRERTAARLNFEDTSPAAPIDKIVLSKD